MKTKSSKCPLCLLPMTDRRIPLHVCDEYCNCGDYCRCGGEPKKPKSPVTNRPEWEKEFDKEFPHFWENPFYEDILYFIDSLLYSQKEELLEKIERLRITFNKNTDYDKQGYHTCNDDICRCDRFNEALDQVKSIIEK